MAVQDYPQRLNRPGRAVRIPGGQQRVIGQQSIDAHHNGVAFPAQLLHPRPGLGAGYPLGIPGIGGDFPVQAHGELGGYKGLPAGNVLGKAFIKLADAVGFRNSGGQAGGLQGGHSLAGYLGIGVNGGGDDLADAGGDNGVSAGGSAPVMAAGFQGSVEGSALGPAAGLRQRADFGMALAGRPGIAFADNKPLRRHHHRPHRRVGADAAHRLAGQSQGAAHRMASGHKVYKPSRQSGRSEAATQLYGMCTSTSTAIVAGISAKFNNSHPCGGIGTGKS